MILRTRPFGVIVEAADPKVERAALLIRAYGHASTETLVATPWTGFLALFSWP